MTDPAPYYRIHLFACTNKRPDGHVRQSCGRHGAEELRDYLKKQATQAGLTDIRVNGAACLDRCELGPVVVIYPEGIWYAMRTKDDVDEIVQTHLIKGGRVDRLMLKPEDGPAKA